MKLRNALFLIASAFIIGGLGTFVLFGTKKAPEVKVAVAQESAKPSEPVKHDTASAKVASLLKSMNMDSPPAGMAAGDFELKTLGGGTVKLSSYKGKAVLLNFWATW